MYCSNCGGQVPDDVRFFGSCGKEVTPATAIESTDQSSTVTDTSEHNARFETIGNQPTIDPGQASAPAAPEIEKGVLFADRYEIRRILGRGGMGTVYEAVDRRLAELSRAETLGT